MITNDDRRLPADPSTIEPTYTTHLTITMNVIPSTPNRTQKRDTPASAGHPLTRRLPTRSSAILNKVDTTVADIRSDYGALRYSPIQPPAEVTAAMGRYLDLFGLSFGAFDFGITRDGQWLAYECNPSGQWLWLEQQTNIGISAALAEHLAAGASE